MPMTPVMLALFGLTTILVVFLIGGCVVLVRVVAGAGNSIPGALVGLIERGNAVRLLTVFLVLVLSAFLALTDKLTSSGQGITALFSAIAGFALGGFSVGGERGPS